VVRHARFNFLQEKAALNAIKCDGNIDMLSLTKDQVVTAGYTYVKYLLKTEVNDYAQTQPVYLECELAVLQWVRFLPRHTVPC